MIKLLRDLQTEKGRQSNRQYFIEEAEIVKRAFDFGGLVDSIILTDKFVKTSMAQSVVEKAERMEVPIYLAAHGLIAKILEAKPTPECMAIVNQPSVNIEAILSVVNPLVMMAEGCENADNLGMLLRSMDAVGADGVILTGDTADPYCRRSVRASRGSVFSKPICVGPDSAEVIRAAKSHGLKVIASSANAETPYTAIDYTLPVMVIVGNETKGISAEVRRLADAVARIPMYGKINSLNIAVAGSVLMFEAVRQRKLQNYS